MEEAGATPVRGVSAEGRGVGRRGVGVVAGDGVGGPYADAVVVDDISRLVWATSFYGLREARAELSLTNAG